MGRIEYGYLGEGVEEAGFCHVGAFWGFFWLLLGFVGFLLLFGFFCLFVF